MDYILIGVIVLILSLAIIYIIRQKRKGVRCIGCSSSGCCHSKGNCCGSSVNQTEELEETESCTCHKENN